MNLARTCCYLWHKKAPPVHWRGLRSGLIKLPCFHALNKGVPLLTTEVKSLFCLVFTVTHRYTLSLSSDLYTKRFESFV